MDDDQAAASKNMAARDRAGEVNAGARPISIDGEVVSRPVSRTTTTVHSFLRHIRAQGLECVAEPLGVNGDVETLSFIAGAAGGDAWYHQHSDQGPRELTPE